LRAEPVSFYTYSNYAFWIKRAEVRIFEKGKSSQQEPFAVVPVKINEAVLWQLPAATPAQVFFLLRVYDEKGRFDETAAKELNLLTARKPSKDEEISGREKLIGYGENSRVLKWVIERVQGKGKAEKTAIGNVPAKDALDVSGLKISDAELNELLSVKNDEWKNEIAGIKEHFAQFGNHLPKELNQELADLEKRLG
jgi:hypothetical protein